MSLFYLRDISSPGGLQDPGLCPPVPWDPGPALLGSRTWSRGSLRQQGAGPSAQSPHLSCSPGPARRSSPLPRSARRVGALPGAHLLYWGPRETGGPAAPPALRPGFPAERLSVGKNPVRIFKVPASPGLGFPVPEAFPQALALLLEGQGAPPIDSFPTPNLPTLLEANTFLCSIPALLNLRSNS